ncbi:MAG: zinc finger MYND domain-containing protein [Acidobacteria bacterium]|jgi:hypothetical protein|nr:zinc finger MYND domain-containing protein [Acidobacteriota bacterium]
MKWLILLVLLALAGVFVAVRFRRQIQMGIYLYRMFKKMRGTNKTDEKQISQKVNPKNVPLVRCARCGTWTPQNRALNLRSQVFYCSANCMESAVKTV